LAEKSIETVGSSIRMSGRACGVSGIGNGLSDLDRLDAGDGDQVSGAGLLHLDSLEPLVAERTVTFFACSRRRHGGRRRRGRLADAAVDDAADEEPADVIVPVEHRGPGTGGHRRSKRGGGTVVRIVSKSGASERPGSRRSDVAEPARAFVYRTGNSSWSGVASRSMKEVVHLVEDLGRPRVARSILLMTTMGGRPASSALFSTKPVCGSGPSAASTRSRTPSTRVSAEKRYHDHGQDTSDRVPARPRSPWTRPDA